MIKDLDQLTLPTKWTLDEALELVRALQPEIRKFGFHLCLGGGVLNNGHSDKDLDLYFLPMGPNTSNPTELVEMLDSMWGAAEPLSTGYLDEPPYLYRLKYWYGKQRIDVFVLGKEEDLRKPEVTEEADINQVAEVPANWRPIETQAATNDRTVAGTYAGIVRENQAFWRNVIPTYGRGMAPIPQDFPFYMDQPTNTTTITGIAPDPPADPEPTDR